jgi:cytochrome c oxidase cbb3-type subunit 3
LAASREPWNGRRQAGRLEDSFDRFEREFADSRQKLLNSSYSELRPNPTAMRAARGLFSRNCSACHGPEGAGNADMGAPDLADNVWLYGNSLSEISTSIAEGRNGVMPAFGDRLDEVQLRLLTALLTRQAD